jgi:hypothetical protein
VQQERKAYKVTPELKEQQEIQVLKAFRAYRV